MKWVTRVMVLMLLTVSAIGCRSVTGPDETGGADGSRAVEAVRGDVGSTELVRPGPIGIPEGPGGARIGINPGVEPVEIEGPGGADPVRNSDTAGMINAGRKWMLAHGWKLL